MYQLSESQEKALATAQGYFKRANLHPSTQKWKKEAIENFGFYDGSGQWAEEDRQKVIRRNQTPLTLNIIQSRLNSVSGVEIQSRFRVAVQNDSGDFKNDILAKGLTHLLYYIQQNQKIPYQGSLKFRDMLVCGIGWSGIYQENGKYYYEHVHPVNIIPDPDDLTPQFTKMKFVCRKRWMEPDRVRKLWPKVAKYVDFNDPYLVQNIYSPEIMDRNMNYTATTSYGGYSQSRVLVGEVQYKIPKKAYYGIDTQGFYFETFDEEKAEDMANSSNDINEKESEQTMRTMFFNDFLLETSPLEPDIPDLKDFGYIPCVWNRRYTDGVCIGLLENMKDLQRDFNVRLTKSLYEANSTRVVIEGNLGPGSTTKQLEEQLKRPDSVINVPTGTKVDFKDNNSLSDQQLKFMNEYILLFQHVSGIYDDAMGKATNATSGVAQRQRQINSVRNNVFAFDSFADMKEREATFILNLIQGGDTENILSQVLTEDEQQSIILNLTRTINGKKYIFNDVRTLPLYLEVEEVPDYKSTVDENKAALESLLSNPMAAVIMQSPTLMRWFGIRDYENLSKEISQVYANQQQQQAANSSNIKGSLPNSPENPGQIENTENLVYPSA